jgi:hypothetical protein
MSGLLAVAAHRFVRVLGFGAFLGHVVLRVAVAANTLGNVGALSCVRTDRETEIS